MKPQLNFKSYSLFLLSLILSVLVSAQNYEASKSLNKNAVVPANVVIDMSNQSGDLKISTIDEKRATLTTSIEIRGNSKEDVDKVIKAIENFTFDLHGNKMEINTRFYKNMMSVGNRKTMTLLNGDKVKIREFKIRHELNIPKTADLILNNKYSEIEIESLEGDADFTLYNTTMHGAHFGSNLKLEAKYSKIYLDEIQNETEIDFYDSEIEFTSCGDIKIESKYSKFEAEKTGKLVIDSYDDKFDFDAVSSLDLKAKYTDFVSRADVSEIHLDLYDCNLQVNSAQKGTYRGKYSELKLGDIKELNVAECYDDDFYLGKTEKIQITQSKYCKYEMKEASSFSLNGYDDNIDIGQLKNGFSGITINGKYEKINIDAGNEPFRLAFKIKYPKIDIPESVKIIKQIKENSDLELVAGETGGKISVEGYDMKVVVDD